MGNKGTVSGVLSIVSGVFGLLGAFCMLIAVAFMSTSIDMLYEMDPYYYSHELQTLDLQTLTNLMNLYFGTTGAVLAILGILGIVGGAYSIQRKHWGVGLAAAIASIITFFPCGIAATIIIAMGKPEFDRSVTAPPVTMPPSSAQPPPQP
ncbi:MAG: hypothetical protein JW967_03675 [Dehalococcoidales bacterium]|nr:hypothetical protein [Dehalococcoidales bacterium]